MEAKYILGPSLINVSFEDVNYCFESVGEVRDVSTAYFSGLAFAFVVFCNSLSLFYAGVNARKGGSKLYAFVSFRTKKLPLKAIQS
jgi:hypothetical protein